MFYYIFDKRVSGVFEKKRSDKALNWIRNHQIAGEYHDATSTEEIIELGKKAINKRFKSIVVVGDDSSLIALLNASPPNHPSQAVFGYIPIIKKSLVANELNLPDYRKALKALAHRKLVSLKLVSFNNHYFPLNLTLTSNGSQAEINIDDKLTLQTPIQTITLTNNHNSPTPHHKPITIIVENTTINKNTSDTSFIELKKQLKKTTASTSPILRYNATTIRIESKHNIECKQLSKSYQRLLIGNKTKEINMIVAKSAGFKS